MPAFYDQLKECQFENLAADPSNTPRGRFWYRTDLTTIKYYDGSSLRTLVETDKLATLTNKLLSDSTCTFINVSDATKIFKLQLSGITTGNTRTWTVPDSSDTFVGLTSTQTLTNKTLTSPTITGPTVTGGATMSGGGSWTGAPSLTAPVFASYADWTEIAAPSSPSAGVRRTYFKTDGKLYSKNSAGTETQIGGGATSGINYIENSDAETDTTGWANYADAAGTSPVDGTGGSPTVAISRVTSSPLRGAAMFRITKDAANRQGEGCSYAFTIATADKAKVLNVSFEYQPSANFVAGDSSDLRVWVYDVTNSVLIPVTPYTLQGGSGSTQKFSGVFQSSASSTSYRLIFHVATTNSSAWTFDFDNVVVGPQLVVYGAPISDWTAFTPTGSWVANSTYTGWWRRVGDSMECMVNIVLAGAPTSANLTINLPSGYSVDTNKLSSSAPTPLGYGNAADSGASEYDLIVRYNSTTAVGVYATRSDGTYVVENNATQAIPITFGNLDSVSVRFMVPISGWGSNTIMSSDAETRIVACQYTKAATTSVNNTTDTEIPFATQVYDTHAAYNTSTGRFTAPVSGKYRVTAMIDFAANATGNRQISVFKNGSLLRYMGFILAPASGSAFIWGSTTVDLQAGETLSVGGYQSSGGALNVAGNGATYNHVTIERVSGPLTIAANETVAARYATSAGSSIPNNTLTIIDFSSKSFDTHNVVTTGASWKFTAPAAGRYRIDAAIQLTTGGGWNAAETVRLSVYKNAAAYAHIYSHEMEAAHGGRANAQGSTLVELLAGDTIDIRILQNSGGAITLEADTLYNHVSIARIGI